MHPGYFNSGTCICTILIVACANARTISISNMQLHYLNISMYPDYSQFHMNYLNSYMCQCQDYINIKHAATLFSMYPDYSQFHMDYLNSCIAHTARLCNSIPLWVSQQRQNTWNDDEIQRCCDLVSLLHNANAFLQHSGCNCFIPMHLVQIFFATQWVQIKMATFSDWCFLVEC